jgi:FKBP-type peptidyl-prolyl cis-trans isomerase FkpA
MKAAVFIFLSLLVLTMVANAEEKKPVSKPAASAAAPAAKSESTPKAGLPKDIKKLIVEDTIVGNGKSAEKGKSIKVHYTGWLYDPIKPMGRGKQFDTSAGKEPFSFTLGGGTVIKGWDEGVMAMSLGEKAVLTMTSDYGYGEAGAGSDIPPNADLRFEVELSDAVEAVGPAPRLRLDLPGMP